jgi:ribose-phosphate pyrophosphokinase
MSFENIALFALNASQPFAQEVAEKLGISLCEHKEKNFEDGEHKTQPLSNVRGKDVFVIQSLYSDLQESINDKLCRLLFFIGCLRDASAQRITAIIPYLGYARQDRKTQPRDPVTTRYIAELLEAVGSDRVVTLDVHDLAAFQNAFRCQTDHLEAKFLFVKHFMSCLAETDQITVVSPDVGGMKRAEQFREALGQALDGDVPLAFMEKSRSKDQLTIGRLAGPIKNRVAIIIDDLISTGSTLLGAAKRCREQGATSVYAAASHGVFVAKANQVVAAEEFSGIVVTNTIPPFRLQSELVAKKLSVLSAADLFAEAIKRIHTGGSLVALLADNLNRHSNH